MPKIELRAEGRIVECAPGTPLRDVCDREKARVPFGCRNGVCGTCEIEILAGAGNLSAIVAPEKETIDSFGIPAGHRLACQAKVLGDCALKPI
ncbi:MAG TPA: 2Fe-2S iron-sulfur cluster-binding protein [Planctomycetota bacterium]|nr:2Fe-2S iron-sulfur cluster-binding protein [Planctomycetota bacterium]